MKKNLKLSLAQILALALLMFMLLPLFPCSTALAVLPSKVLITNSTGSITWTNATPYSAIRADVLRFDLVQPTDATVTLKRVSAIGFTNTLGTVTIASGVGSWADTNTTVYSTGDKLLVTGMGTNSIGRLNFEFNVYP